MRGERGREHEVSIERDEITPQPTGAYDVYDRGRYRLEEVVHARKWVWMSELNLDISEKYKMYHPREREKERSERRLGVGRVALAARS